MLPPEVTFTFGGCFATGREDVRMKILDLNGKWELRDAAGAPLCSVEVPGTVISGLCAAGKIENPYYRENEYAVRDLFWKDYRFVRSFVVDKELMGAKELNLVCRGLDTLAQICINGKELAVTDNMHRTYTFSVREYVQEGENEICITFRSVLRYIEQYSYRENREIRHVVPCGAVRGNQLVRKGHSMFGWDWGPQLVDAGIWRDIYIEGNSGAKIEDVRIRQFHEADGSVRLRVTIELSDAETAITLPQILAGEQAETAVRVTLAEKDRGDDSGAVAAVTAKYTAEIAGKGRSGDVYEAEIVVEEPKLWWPNGYGEQALYKLTVSVEDRAAADAGKDKRTAVQTVERTIGLGDVHYWDVWHGQKPFSDYQKYYFRFCSEFGFQSFPCLKTVESFTQEQDRNIFSRVMESHQKNGSANGRILYYLSENFKYPKDFGSLLYVSQILQGMAIKSGVDHWRRNRGRCMGSLYWQINDNWPVASWASIDYYGRWKALHYMAAKFYAPVAVSIQKTQDSISVWLENETLSEQKCSVSLRVRDMGFHVIKQWNADGQAGALSAAELIRCPFRTEFADTGFAGADDLYLEAEVVLADKTVLTDTDTLVPYKHLALPRAQLKTAVRELADGFEITVCSDGFAPFVEMDFADADVIFSDNFFTISNERPVVVRLDRKDILRGSFADAADLRARLVLTTVEDTF